MIILSKLPLGPGTLCLGPGAAVVSARRWISGRATRTEPLAASRPKPWPYQEKSYNNFHCYWDSRSTRHRWDENTKLISVEGPPALEKSALAAAIAEELEMKYFPMVTTEAEHINAYGWDIRSIDDRLPPRVRAWDEARFLREPNHEQVFGFQCHKLFLKLSQYYDALAHLMNTGEGVVVERCVYSDIAFAEAMHKAGYINKDEMAYYNKIFKRALNVCIKPHLVIYLDAPVSTVESKIAARKHPNESKTINTKFLEALEESYKLKFLREIEEHAELLVYDWSEPGNAEVVVEDIERIDFDCHEADIHNPKMIDWRWAKEWSCNERRWEFTHRKAGIINEVFRVTHFNIPSLMLDNEDSRIKEQILDELEESGSLYEKGYNPGKGENWLFNLKNPKPWSGLGKQTRWA